MPRKVDESKDKEIANYLKDHTYLETQEQFGISAMQVSRIKQRSQSVQPSTPEPESKTLDEPAAQPDRERKVIEPQRPKIEKEKPIESEIKSEGITIIKLMSIYEQLTGKSFPRIKGTTKNKIRDAITAILNRE